jgi:hypothetical protein
VDHFQVGRRFDAFPYHLGAGLVGDPHDGTEELELHWFPAHSLDEVHVNLDIVGLQLGP